MSELASKPASESFRPHEITRPHPRLLQYYLLAALLTGPLSPFVILPLFFRYYTLRYEFDDRGVSMKWGILFRREILLTYRRIQDIHLTRNILQRWLGLATVSLQTASGATGAEMSIEGILEAEALRDYLYGKMRGARRESSAHGEVASTDGRSNHESDEALVLLREIRDSLAQLANRPGGVSMSRRVEVAAATIYEHIWNVVETWFKVPADPPTLPAEPPQDVTSFRPAPGFLRYLKFLFWLFLVLIDGTILVVWLLIFIAVPWLGVLLALPAAAVAILPDIVAYVAIHLRYDTTWYVVGRRSLRIRRGIWIINETTITFENVQNIHITQGPVERYFGIANVIVETAGGGGGGHGKGEAALTTHVGMIEGIDNAEELRTLIMGRLRQSKSAGLGDEDDADTTHHATGFTAEHLAVLREIRDAARVR